MTRTILHVDLDAFFAAVEQRDDPTLRGRPVVVGGAARRGVVAAASYEARRYGIRSAMPMAEAMRRCRDLVVVPPRHAHYQAVSSAFFAILARYSPLIEGLSLDEAFLDLTGSTRLFGDPQDICARIKREVRAELDLVVSCGVAPVKLAAKIASDLDKPDGLRVVPPDGVAAFLAPLPVGRLWGVGARTQASLQELAVLTIGDLARYPLAPLRRRLGATSAEALHALANGIDPRPVVPDQAPVSIGHQETLDRDTIDRTALGVRLLEQADRVARRLRLGAVRAGVVVLIVKHDDFRQLTRRRTLAAPTHHADELAAVARALLEDVPLDDAPGQRVRLIGLSTTALIDDGAPQQLDFAQPERAKGEALGATLDRLSAKFGETVVRRAVHLPSTRARK